MVKRISMERLIEFGVAFMTKRDVPEDHALYVSRIVVETEAFRQSTHGLAQYVAINEALGKTIDPQVEPTIIGKHGATVLLDGKRCLGILVMKLAKKMAVEIARTDGVGFVGVRNTHWIGALGMHLISIAEQGLLCPLLWDRSPVQYEPHRTGFSDGWESGCRGFFNCNDINGCSTCIDQRREKDSNFQVS